MPDILNTQLRSAHQTICPDSMTTMCKCLAHSRYSLWRCHCKTPSITTTDAALEGVPHSLTVDRRQLCPVVVGATSPRSPNAHRLRALQVNPTHSNSYLPALLPMLQRGWLDLHIFPRHAVGYLIVMQPSFHVPRSKLRLLGHTAAVSTEVPF